MDDARVSSQKALLNSPTHSALDVMAGLVPAIHALNTPFKSKAWMPGTRPGMTAGLDFRTPVGLIVRPLGSGNVSPEPLS